MEEINHHPSYYDYIFITIALSIPRFIHIKKPAISGKIY